MILLDTNVLVGILRGDSKLAARFAEHSGDIAIPVMVLGELHYGTEKSSNPARNRLAVAELVDALPVMHTTDEIMALFGKLKASLARRGEIVADADLLIAATALFYDATLVTANVHHFSRFANLKLDNWSV